MEPADLRERWEAARQKLLEVRSERTRPHRDEKIVTAWNGLMIAALAKTARAVGDEQLLADAERAAGFVLEELHTGDGRLLRYSRDGAAEVPGFADDYAFLAWGLLEMYEARFDLSYLEQALELSRRMLELFWDEERGGFALVGEDAEQPVVRPREVQDGALPSSNSVALLVLERLALLSGRDDLQEHADRLMESLSGEVARYPSGYTQFLCGVDFAIGPQQEIVVAGDPAAEGTRRLSAVVHSEFLPRSVLLMRPVEGDETDRLVEIAPYAAEMKPVDGRPAAYVCRDYSCREPVADPDALRALLREEV
jgi:hypothetical protein